MLKNLSATVNEVWFYIPYYYLVVYECITAHWKYAINSYIPDFLKIKYNIIYKLISRNSKKEKNILYYILHDILVLVLIQSSYYTATFTFY